jgi:hypothetical protein
MYGHSQAFKKREAFQLMAVLMGFKITSDVEQGWRELFLPP